MNRAIFALMSLHLKSINLESARERKLFMSLYYKVSEENDKWIPIPRLIYKDQLNPSRNPFLRNMWHTAFVMLDGLTVVGRFMLMKQSDSDQSGTFGYFDFTSHGEELVEFMMAEARANGIVELTGPFNPNIHSDLGVLNESQLDTPTYFMMNFSPRRYREVLEKSGFNQTERFSTFELRKADFEEASHWNRLVERINRNQTIEVRPANMNRFKDEVDLFHSLYNQSFAEHWGFEPVSREEFWYLAGDLKLLIQSNLALIAECGGKPVGFVLGVPNLNEYTARKDGKLNLVGVLRFIIKGKKARTSRVMIAGVLPEYRNKGASIKLFNQIASNMFANGVIKGEIGWVIDGNKPLNHSMKLMNAQKDKSYVVYRKSISVEQY